MTAEIDVRPAVAADREAIIALCTRSLQWKPEDPNADFYSWKHDRNPAGTSPTWVATTDDGRIVGLRVFLRWDYIDGNGRRYRTVRAVDTATDPDFKKRGIFTRLTLGALEPLAEMGVDFIFNTPNDQSRPGYEKMGWRVDGRVPAVARPALNPSSWVRMRSARTSAELWSQELPLGVEAAEALADDAAVGRLLAARTESGVHTDRTIAHLRWRFGFAPLRYRAVLLGTQPDDGMVILRLRRRGAARELVLAQGLWPDGTPASAIRRALRRAAAAAQADYVLATAHSAGRSLGFVPVSVGPLLALREVTMAADAIPVPQFSLADIELF